MSAARILGALLPLVLLIAAAGIPWMLRRERRHPTSYTRRPAGDPVMRAWRSMSGVEQGAADTAVLNAQEAAEDAVRRAAEVRERAVVAEAAKRNALFHP